MSHRARATSCTLQQMQTRAYIPKGHALFVQVGNWLEGDVELGAIAVAALVGHPEDSSSLVTDGEVFIWEKSSGIRGSTCAASFLCCTSFPAPTTSHVFLPH